MACESDLYPPVKDFLESQGYAVKGEIGGCDVFAVRGDEPPVIVELKRRFTLELVLQGIDRLAVTDAVYLAVPQPGRRASGAGPYDCEVRKLCRRLGVGLMVVDPERAAERRVEVLLDPAPYVPRRDKARAARLLGEHARRVGDPNRGGSTRVPIVTAYRQDAMRCARLLRDLGPSTLKALRQAGAPPDVAAILQRDVYGWFERVERGVYALAPAGRDGLDRFAHALAESAVS
jgi:hypothetical protein